MAEELRIFALNGSLGYGYDRASFEAGIGVAPQLIGCDSGSTDPGPYYLGSGRSLVKAEQIVRDLKPALLRARAAGIPFVVGSAGFAGARPNLDFFLDILHTVVRDEGLRFRLAVIASDVPKATVLQALAAGRIEAMPCAPPLKASDVEQSIHIVGQMGTSPYIRAFELGADVVIAGRSCDTSIYAAYPIWKGYDPALAFHMAKIMECGAQCAVPLAANDCLLGTLRRDHFLVRPLASQRVCTPESVAAHTMYEQGNPFLIYEPDGVIDVRDADFRQIDRQTVRVSGSRFAPTNSLRIKLEGARRVGARAFTIAGVRDPNAIANLDFIEGEVRASVRRNLDSAVQAADYQLHFRWYGRDAVLGELEHAERAPHEVGALIEAIAPTQALANHVLSMARSSCLHCHFPGRKATAGNLAFPFSPSDYEGGDVYEFSVYHLMQVDDENALFPIEMVTV